MSLSFERYSPKGHCVWVWKNSVYISKVEKFRVENIEDSRKKNEWKSRSSDGKGHMATCASMDKICSQMRVIAYIDFFVYVWYNDHN